jgi:hypothetical protein
LCDGALDKYQAKINVFLRVYKLREREVYIVANLSKVAMTQVQNPVSSVGRGPTTNDYQATATPAAEATATIFDRLENELVATIRKYKEEIRKAYNNVRDPQHIDETLDSIVATVIRELEDTGYYFDTAAIDNVLYHLDRTIDADEWEVVEEEGEVGEK